MKELLDSFKDWTLRISVPTGLVVAAFILIYGEAVSDLHRFFIERKVWIHAGGDEGSIFEHIRIPPDIRFPVSVNSISQINSVVYVYLDEAVFFYDLPWLRESPIGAIKRGQCFIVFGSQKNGGSGPSSTFWLRGIRDQDC